MLAGRAVLVIGDQFDQIAIRIIEKNRFSDAGVVWRVKWDPFFLEFPLRLLEVASVHQEGKVPDDQALVRIANRRGIGSEEESETHCTFTDHPGGLPLVYDVEAQNALIPLRRGIQVADVDAGVIDTFEFHSCSLEDEACFWFVE